VAVTVRALAVEPRALHMRYRLRLSLGCAGVAMLSACASGGGGGQQSVSTSYYLSHAAHDYTPPGPPSDPWGPYINEASAKFDVPPSWIRQVMHVESGGHEYIDGQLTVSAAGAMGLMQLEPQTYQDMAAQYGLGSDAFNPYDNIMAGTAYIHQMYQVYGSPGFLAAYNAGPGRLNSYMNYHTALPQETVTYVAMIAPHIQGDYPVHRSEADEMALNTLPITDAPGILPVGFTPEAPSAYSPDNEAAAPVQMAYNAPPPAYEPPPVSEAPVSESLPAIYNPGAEAAAPAASAPVSVSEIGSGEALPPPPPPPMRSSDSGPVVQTAYIAPPPPPPPHFGLFPEAMADTPPETIRPHSSHHHSGWAIQVGAYDTSSNARAALGIAELSAVEILVNGRPMVISTHEDGHTKYRARFVGLMRDDAIHACSRLSGGPTGCVVVPPDEQS